MAVKIILAFLLSFVHSIASDHVNLKGFCNKKPDGLYQLAKCSGNYVGCVKGTASLRHCPAQQVFEEFSRRCVPKPTDKGDSREEDRHQHHSKCTHQRDGLYSLDERKCHPHYLICFNGDGKVKECDNGQVFDPVSAKCRLPRLVAECHIKVEEVCAPITVKTGDVFPDPRNCRGFIVCDRGKNCYKQCDKGLGWHRHKQQCVPLHYSSCEPH